MTIATWLLIAALTASLLRAHHRLVLVARASHELRGPLSAMQLGLHGLSGEPARKAAVELELRRAGRALEDLAAARAGTRARGGVERVDLAELVVAHEAAWRTLAAVHGAPLRVGPPIVVLPFAADGGDVRAPLTVIADPLRLAQACANLVANAAEHGRGEIRVRVRAAAGQVTIEVADEGPGLPAPLSAMIAPARWSRGLRGHGLAIAAGIASQHGGRLSADGSRMTLALPVAGRPVPRTRRARAAAALRRWVGARDHADGVAAAVRRWRMAATRRHRTLALHELDRGGVTAPDRAGLAAPGDALADRVGPAVPGDALADRVGPAAPGDALADRAGPAVPGDALADRAGPAAPGDAPPARDGDETVAS